MLHTLTATLEDSPGVLDRVAALFRRRAFNIHSLTVSPGEGHGLSRMTVTVDADETGVRRVVASLGKLIQVRGVTRHGQRAVMRDLALARVKATESQRPQVLQIAHIFHAQIVDLDLESLVLECTGSRDKLDRFIALLEPFGLLELARSGVVAMAQTPQPSPFDLYA
ncbi:MAG: acetolactate synthase small subunit [Acidobacteria bacterium]|nr:acetolactate synthase small subunit [Acidobacteriota bacterium]